jgi:hypothetical protein
MRPRLFIILLLAVAPTAYAQLDLQGYVAARGANATGQPSWLEGGFGRLEAGGERDDIFGAAQLGFEWTATSWLDIHVSGAARRDPDEFGGDDFGLVEGFIDLHTSLGTSNDVRLRAGQFFLPTSRENKGELWTSPYSISFSALNTWIAEEFRPIGAELEWRHAFTGGDAVTGAVSAFRGNDSMGALLAWRGWTVGNRLSTYDEVLPLPPLGSFDTFFADQRRDGTKPFGDDLDGRTGFTARLRWSRPERANVQYAYVDNQGDRALHAGEYAWETNFHLLSAEFGDPNNLILAAEYMTGATGMGLQTAGFAQADFHAAYVLLSDKRGRNRWTARYDLFGTEERDHSPAESNEETGRSWTLAWLYDLTPKIRIGAEMTQITGKRPAAQQYGFDPDTNGRTVTLEARYSF